MNDPLAQTQQPDGKPWTNLTHELKARVAELEADWAEASKRFGLDSNNGDLLNWLSALVDDPDCEHCKSVIAIYVSRDCGKPYTEVFQSLWNKNPYEEPDRGVDGPSSASGEGIPPAE